ncbi:MAG: cell division protein FtsQ/DivIB [Flavobacteriaceae bacterium]
MSKLFKNTRISKTMVLNTKLMLLVILMVFLSAFASERNANRFLSSTPIIFENPNQPLISEETVNKLLIQNKGSLKNIRKVALDLNKLENELIANPYIRTSNVYVSVNGEVGVDVLQKKPLARVLANKAFYIDEEGEKMPTSPNFSVRVPLVSGQVDKNNLTDVYKLLKSIASDEFFSKEVEGVIVTKNKYTLLVREFDFLIDFGTTEHRDVKIQNFKAFYKKALKDKTIESYNRVNLQIASQVICTKK